MRYLLCAFTIFFVTTASAQPLPENVVSALQDDDAEHISEFATAENINACFEYKKSSYTLIALSIKAEAQQSFNQLLKQQADLSKACASKTPLMYASKYGKVEMIRALIKSGSDHRVKNSKGLSALDYAKKYRQKEAYMYLKALK